MIQVETDSRFDDLFIDFDGDYLRIKAFKVIDDIEYTREIAIPAKYLTSSKEFTLSTLLSEFRTYE